MSAHPGGYHNIVAHPDGVVAEVDGARHTVYVEQLESDERADAWRRIVAAAPRFGGYEQKTDRSIPVLRLTSDPGPGRRGRTPLSLPQPGGRRRGGLACR